MAASAARGEGPVVKFYYDIQCPFAYQASLRLPEIAKRTGAMIIWKPVLLGGIYKSVQAPQGKNGSASDVMTHAKVKWFERDLQLGLYRHGISNFKWNHKHPVRSLDAMRIIAGTPDETKAEVTAAFYKLYWEENGDVSDMDALVHALVTANLDSALWKLAQCPISKDTLRDNTDEVVSYGAFGVPAFVVNEKFYWGTDRLFFVEQRLANDFSIGPLRLVPRPLSLENKAKLTFYFDVGSPWSYLVHSQLDRVATECNAVVELKPVYTGALYRGLSKPLSIRRFPPSRRLWVIQDLVYWTEFWGLPFVLNSNFPMRTVNALRLVIVRPELCGLLFAAAWEENMDLSNQSVLVRVLDDAGYDGKTLLNMTEAKWVKAALRANVAEALDAGVCDLPAVSVNGGPVIIGHDRVNIVEDLCCGWDCPVAPNTPEPLRAKL